MTNTEPLWASTLTTLGDEELSSPGMNVNPMSISAIDETPAASCKPPSIPTCRGRVSLISLTLFGNCPKWIGRPLMLLAP